MIQAIKEFLLKPSGERGKLFNATIGTLQSVFWAVAITSVASYFLLGSSITPTPTPIDTSGYNILGYNLSEYDETLNDLQLEFRLQFEINDDATDKVKFKAYFTKDGNKDTGEILAQIDEPGSIESYLTFETDLMNYGDFKIREHPDEPFNILNRSFAEQDFLFYEWYDLFYNKMYEYFEIEKPDIILNGLDTFKVFGFGDHFSYTIDKINMYNELITQAEYETEHGQVFGNLTQDGLNYGSTAGQLRRILQFTLLQLESQAWQNYLLEPNSTTNLLDTIYHAWTTGTDNYYIDYDGVQEWQPSINYIYYAGYKIKLNIWAGYFLPSGFSGCVDTSGGGLFG